jgi:hypothetical protein
MKTHLASNSVLRAAMTIGVLASAPHCSGASNSDVVPRPATEGTDASTDGAVASRDASGPDADRADGASSGNGAPSTLIVAFEAPLPSDEVHFNNFVSRVLPHISGPGFLMPWANVDACGDAPCASEEAFDWAAIDSSIMAYINNAATPFASGCAGHRACRALLIVQPTQDSGNDNASTPKYVFSPSYAAALSPPAPPQDVMVCKNEQGSIGGPWKGAPLPVGGSFSSTDTATWNADDGAIVAGTGLHLVAGGFPTSNFSGYPVEYEAPFRTAYENFIKNLLIHYSPLGHGDGPTIAPYLAYIRFGLHGGENDPACSLDGNIPGVDWKAAGQVGAGDLVHPSGAGNPGGFYFMANGPGQSGATEPTWCQTPYCDTPPDGTTPGWRNTGYAPKGDSASHALWPGPQGQASQPQGFTDQAYLDFVHGLYAFLASQHSAIPLDISSHDGPPFNQNWAYADSEAVSAVRSGIGFGNEGVNIQDHVEFEDSHVPSSQHDWVENFDLFGAAPVVRHLQTLWPGSGGVQAENFSIESVVVSGGTATTTCSNGDCSVYCTGGPVEITGNANAKLDGTWLGTATSCGKGTVAFPVATGIPDGSFAGGTIWGPDYLPVTLPFARAHGVTAFELHECTLDYAFGVETVGYTAHACTGSPGPDTTYQALLAAAQQ